MAAYVFAYDLLATGPDYNDDFVISCLTDCDYWGIAFRNGLLGNFVRGGEVQFVVMRIILITFKTHARSFFISELKHLPTEIKLHSPKRNVCMCHGSCFALFANLPFQCFYNFPNCCLILCSNFVLYEGVSKISVTFAIPVNNARTG